MGRLWQIRRAYPTLLPSCKILHLDTVRDTWDVRFREGRVRTSKDENMKNIKFVVKVNRGVTLAPQYVQRIDPVPIHMTTNRKLALVMGKFMAEDAVKSLQTSRCIPELVSVRVA